MIGRDARHVRQGRLPPGGIILKTMRIDIERPLGPGSGAKRTVGRRRHWVSRHGLQAKGGVIG